MPQSENNFEKWKHAQTLSVLKSIVREMELQLHTTKNLMRLNEIHPKHQMYYCDGFNDALKILTDYIESEVLLFTDE